MEVQDSLTEALTARERVEGWVFGAAALTAAAVIFAIVQ